MSRRCRYTEETVNRLHYADAVLERSKPIEEMCGLLSVANPTDRRWRREYGSPKTESGKAAQGTRV